MRGQGEYVAAVTMIAIAILFSYLALQWLSYLTSTGAEVGEGVLRLKERLAVVYPYNDSPSQVLVVSEWDGSSAVRGYILLKKSGSYVYVEDLFEVPVGGKIVKSLPVSIDPDVTRLCIYTENLNIFCNTTQPPTYLTLTPGLWYAAPRAFFSNSNATAYGYDSRAGKWVEIPTYLWDANRSWVIFYLPQGIEKVIFRKTPQPLPILNTSTWFSVEKPSFSATATVKIIYFTITVSNSAQPGYYKWMDYWSDPTYRTYPWYRYRYEKPSPQVMVCPLYPWGGVEYFCDAHLYTGNTTLSSVVPIATSLVFNGTAVVKEVSWGLAPPRIAFDTEPYTLYKVGCGWWEDCSWNNPVDGYYSIWVDHYELNTQGFSAPQEWLYIGNLRIDFEKSYPYVVDSYGSVRIRGGQVPYHTCDVEFFYGLVIYRCSYRVAKLESYSWSWALPAATVKYEDAGNYITLLKGWSNKIHIELYINAPPAPIGKTAGVWKADQSNTITTSNGYKIKILKQVPKSAIR